MSKRKPSPMARMAAETNEAARDAMHKRAADNLRSAEDLLVEAASALGAAQSNLIVASGEKYILAGKALIDYGQNGGRLP